MPYTPPIPPQWSFVANILAAQDRVNAPALDNRFAVGENAFNSLLRDLAVTIRGDNQLADGVVSPRNLTPDTLALFSGFTYLLHADVATTGNLALTGEQLIDGFQTAGSRVLVKNQTDATQNGIYTSGAGAWVRTADSLVMAVLTVLNGRINAGTMWLSPTAAITLGTTPIPWESIGSTVAKAGPGYLRPEYFGALGDGVADDSSAWLAAITAAMATGQTVVGTPGATYKVSALYVLLTGDLSIDGQGSRMVQGSNATMLSIEAAASWIGAMAPLWTGSAAGIGGTGAQNNTGTDSVHGYGLDIADVSGTAGYPTLTTKSWVKVLADDTLPWSQFVSITMGQASQVREILSAGRYKLDTGLIERASYVTNPKLAVYANWRLNIRNMRFATDLTQTLWTAGLLQVTGCVKPVIRDCLTEWAWGFNIAVRGSVQPMILDCGILGGVNDSAQNQFCYGFGSYANLGAVIRCWGGNVRHMCDCNYNSNTTFGPITASPLCAGADIGTTYLNCQATNGNGNAASSGGDNNGNNSSYQMESHEGCIGLTYMGCHISQGRHGIALRGRMIRIIDCMFERVDIAMQSLDVSNASLVGAGKWYNLSACDDIELVNTSFIDIRQQLINTSQIPNRFRMRGGEIRMNKATGLSTYLPQVSLSSWTCEMTEVRFTGFTYASCLSPFGFSGPVRLITNRCIFDLSGIGPAETYNFSGLMFIGTGCQLQWTGEGNRIIPRKRARLSPTITSTALAAIAITEPGGGYDYTPAVTVTGDGTGATATVTMTNGIITGATVTAPGTGYTYMALDVAPPISLKYIIDCNSQPCWIDLGFTPEPDLFCNNGAIRNSSKCQRRKLRYRMGRVTATNGITETGQTAGSNSMIFNTANPVLSTLANGQNLGADLLEPVASIVLLIGQNYTGLTLGAGDEGQLVRVQVPNATYTAQVEGVTIAAGTGQTFIRVNGAWSTI